MANYRIFLCSLKADCVLIMDFWPYEICTMYMSLPDLWSKQYCASFENYGKNASLTVQKKFWDSNRTCRLNDDSFCHCRTSRCFVWHEWHFNKTTCKASCSLTKQQLNMTVQRLRYQGHCAMGKKRRRKEGKVIFFPLTNVSKIYQCNVE